MRCRIQNLTKIGWILAELGPVKLGDEEGGEEGEEGEGYWHYLVNQPGLAWLGWVLTIIFME